MGLTLHLSSYPKQQTLRLWRRWDIVQHIVVYHCLCLYCSSMNIFHLWMNTCIVAIFSLSHMTSSPPTSYMQYVCLPKLYPPTPESHDQQPTHSLHWGCMVYILHWAPPSKHWVTWAIVPPTVCIRLHNSSCCPELHPPSPESRGQQPHPLATCKLPVDLSFTPKFTRLPLHWLKLLLPVTEPRNTVVVFNC